MLVAIGLHCQGIGLALQRHVHLLDVGEVSPQDLLMPQITAGGGHQGVVLVSGNLVDDGGIADPYIGGHVLVVIVLLALFRITAESQRKGLRRFRTVLVGDGIVHRHRQLRIVQPIDGQRVPVGGIGHIIGEIQIGDGAEIAVHRVVSSASDWLPSLVKYTSSVL